MNRITLIVLAVVLLTTACTDLTGTVQETDCPQAKFQGIGWVTLTRNACWSLVVGVTCTCQKIDGEWGSCQC